MKRYNRNNKFPTSMAEQAENPLELPLHTFNTKNKKEIHYKNKKNVVCSLPNARKKQNSAFVYHVWAPKTNGNWISIMSNTVATKSIKLIFNGYLPTKVKLRNLKINMSSQVTTFSPYQLSYVEPEYLKLLKRGTTFKKLLCVEPCHVGVIILYKDLEAREDIIGFQQQFTPCYFHRKLHRVLYSNY